MGLAGFLWSCLYISSVLFAVELVFVHLEPERKRFGARTFLRFTAEFERGINDAECLGKEIGADFGGAGA